MVEYSFRQLMGVCCAIMEICEKHGLTSDDLDQMRVRLSDPQLNGDISFDLGIPGIGGRLEPSSFLRRKT